MPMVREAVEDIKTGAVTFEERLEEKIDLIEEKDGEINAFITKLYDYARDYVKNAPEDLLYGLVVGVKDVFAMKGVRMTCGSKMLESYVAPYDATPVMRIKNSGGAIVGKLNMDEFAAGSSGETSYFGPTRNPRDLDRVPGGSSSGSGAAVAAGFVDVALSSDTGGSIRNPASFCGVVGLKPTYGLVSRYGLADLAMSMDTPGIISDDTYGVALGMEAIQGADPRDATCAGIRLPFLRTLESFDPDRTVIGVPFDLLDGVDPHVLDVFRKAVSFYEQNGCEVREVSFPDGTLALAAYYIVNYAEFSSAMQKYDGLKYGHRGTGDGLEELVSASRSEALGREVKRRILLGTFVTMKEQSGKWYTAALWARALIRRKIDALFREVDHILLPTVPFLPFRIGERIDDPVAMYLSDVFTVFANLGGYPAVSFPGGERNGLPVGVQIMGRRFEDHHVLAAARFFEREGP